MKNDKTTRLINYTPESVEERRKYALLQAAAVLAASVHEDNWSNSTLTTCVGLAADMLDEIEKREKEKRFE